MHDITFQLLIDFQTSNRKIAVNTLTIAALSAEQKEVRSKTKKSTPAVKTLRSNSIQSVVSVVSESNTTASIIKVGIFGEYFIVLRLNLR